MKKLTKLIACFGLLFAVAGCSSSKINDDALDKLEDSIKKFSEVQSFDYAIGMDAPAMDMKAEVNGTLLSEGPQISMNVDLEASGQKMEKFMELYLKDNMMYMSMFGTKQKQEADMSPLGSFSFDPETLNFDKEKIKEGLSEASLEGDTIHLVIKDDLVKESMAKGETDLTSLGMKEVTGISIDIKLVDDFMSSATMNIIGTSDDGEVTVSAYINLDNINNASKISYPADLEEWPLAESTGPGLE